MTSPRKCRCFSCFIHDIRKNAAKLSGSNEVPSVNTAGSGVADFQLSADGKSPDYQVTLTKVNSVMAVHIHSGKQAQTGDPVAGLFNPSMSGLHTGLVTDHLTKGTITSAGLGNRCLTWLIL